MPNIVINQDMADYVKYSKKKAREDLQKAIATIVFFILAAVVLYYILWSAVHIT